MSRHRTIPAVLLLAVLLGPVHLEAYERIISFRPNVTEILFALGLGPKVAGVTTFCRNPPEALKIEKIGGYFNRSLEKVLTLKPDLVVMVPDATTSRTQSALGRAGIETLVVSADSIEDVYDSITSIASKNGIPEKGLGLVEKMKRQIADESAKIAALPRKRTLMVIQRTPLITAGAGTFLNSLLALAGGENIAGASVIPYPRFSMESVVARRPEVIIDLDPTDPGDFWSRYPSLPAVRDGAIRRADADLFTPGPRLPDALSVLIDVIARSPKGEVMR